MMRRRGMPGPGLLAAACLGLAVTAGCSTSMDGSSPSRPSSTATMGSSVRATSPTAAPPLCPAGSDELRCADVSSMELAPVLRIVDGDTLHVEFDGRDESVRLYGIDAPEAGTRCADDATERLGELAGGAVRMRRDARDRDRYKRLLRYVYTPAGESIDATLVREGLARAWRGDGQLEQELSFLEADARGAGRGCLWGGM
jgi:endonuclease YncB( thermonuclease family)